MLLVLGWLIVSVMRLYCSVLLVFPNYFLFIYEQVITPYQGIVKGEGQTNIKENPPAI